MISFRSLNSTWGIQMTVYIALNMDTYSTSEGQLVVSDLRLISVLLSIHFQTMTMDFRDILRTIDKKQMG